MNRKILSDFTISRFRFLDFLSNLRFIISSLFILSDSFVSFILFPDPLNKNAARLKLDRVTEKDFKIYFPPFKSSTDTTKATISCHYEAKIALYMTNFFSPSIKLKYVNL